MKNYYKLHRQVALLAAFVLVMLSSFGQIQHSVVPPGGTAGNTDGSGADPIDDFFNSIRYQTVYTVAELNAAGMQAGTVLTALAWDVTQAPGTLNDYTIKLGHTSASDCSAHVADPTTIVKNPFPYTPTVGINDIVFDATFTWNGTDNLLVEICTGPSNPYASPYGGVNVQTGLTNAARFVRADASGSQCAVATTTTLNAKPNIRLTEFFPAPPTPTQDPAAPTCSAGTLLDLAGPEPTDVEWYWQTSATGTSMATPYTGPYAVFSNGTYYARAYHTTYMVWSAATSITVSNFPLAPVPPAPVAAQNPACAATGGTTLTMPAAPAGTEYYWQGTTVNGTSNALPASTAYPVTTSGTYQVAAYETASQCWSNTTALAVTVDSYVPAVPTALETNYNICTGTVSHEIEATPPPGGPGGNYTVSFGTNLVSTGAGVTFNAVLPAIPADAVITSAQVQLTNVNSINGSWRSEIRVALNGAYTLAPTQISTLTSAGLISPDPVINLTGLPNAGGSVNLVLTETYDDGGAGTDDATFGEVKIVVTYTQNPVSTLAWYDAASAGTQIGTTSPFETVGTSVLPNTNTAGPYTFYAASVSGGCQSATRLPVTVNVTEVLAELTPVNVTCNGSDNGSFTLGAVECGTAPFLYSIDGGVTFGPIPMNLTAGTYNVIMQDAVMGESAPITVVITEPGIPSALTVDDVNYFNTVISWTAEGDETQWFVEYGPAGFTPGTGTVDTANATTWTIEGLSPDTDYEFYVAADCGGTDGWAGPVSFSTNAGFYTYDNNCGPGFTDIAATGTNNALTDDAEVGVTLPFAFSYQGTAYTDITIGNNGGIIFGTLTGQVPFGNGAIGGAPIGLYPFWDDMAGEGTGVFYQTIGTAPNQQFIVQWNKEHLGGAEGDELIYQLVLDQATNEAYFYYSDVIAGDVGEDYGASATIGASGPIDVSVSQNDPAFLQNNSCVHFYNALCPNPVNITTQVFSEEAFLNWSAGLYGETEWTIVYGPAGFDPAAMPSQAIDTLEGLMTPDAIISGLTQLTEYDAYIYSECSADNLTSGGVLVTFTTLPNCSNPSDLSGLTLEDTLDLAWDWMETPGYAITGFNVTYGMTGFDVYSQDGTEEATGATDLFYTVDDASLIAGGLYDVYVQAVCGSDTSTYVGPITLIMPLTNDAVCGAEMLAADGTVYTFNNNGATVESGESAIAPPADGAQVTTGWTNSTLNGTTWFTFVAPATGSVRINNTAINYNGQVAVYEGTDCADFATFTLDGANDNEIDGSSVAPNFTICGLTPGSTYYLMHDGFNGTTGNYSVSITPIVLNAGTAAAVTDICTGTAIDLFNTVDSEDAGGVWTSANNIAAVNASINGSDFSSEGLAYQVFNFQYRVTDGCAYDSIITQVHIFGPSSAGEDGVITACKNEPIDLLSGLNVNADLTGTWYDPTNAAIPSSAIITSTIAGQYNYDYIAGNGVCPNDTANVVVNVLDSCDWLDIQEEVFAGVSLYPNPSEGIVFITSDVTEAFDYTITDAKGALIAKANSAIKGAQANKIDLSNVETGVYFIRLSNSQAEKVFRVVIQ